MLDTKCDFQEEMVINLFVELFKKESINTNLKNSLWNTISECIFNEYSRPYLARINIIPGKQSRIIFKLLFHRYFKKRIDQIPYSIESTVAEIDTYFLKHTNGMKFYNFY